MGLHDCQAVYQSLSLPAHWGTMDQPIAGVQRRLTGERQMHVPTVLVVAIISLTSAPPATLRSAAKEFYGPSAKTRLSLDRTLTSEYLGSIARQRDDAKRTWMLLELLARPQTSLKMPTLLPYLGEFRQDLLDINESRLFEKDGPGGESPGHMARLLLAYWQDPADDKLTMPWLKVTQSGYAPSEPIRAATVEEACAAHATAHFRRDVEKGKEIPPYSFQPPVLGPKGERAWVEFSVRYDDWGYKQTLVLRKDGEEWELRFHVEGEHSYSRPTSGKGEGKREK